MDVQIPIIQGDFGYLLNFALTDINGNIFSLSGATSLLFRVQKQGITQLKFAGVMAITSASAGTCSYTVAAGNFDTAGQYTAEIQVNFSTTEQITFSNINLTAAPRVPF